MNKDKQVKKETEWEKEQIETKRMIKNYYLDQGKKLVEDDFDFLEDDPIISSTNCSIIEDERKLIKELIHLRFKTMYKNVKRMYENGEGVKQDYTEALKYFKLAADQGDAGALNYLGIMYYNGHGVKQDYAEAFKYFKLSAYEGNCDGAAEFNLWNMYYNGHGVKQDYVEAFEYYKLAADRGCVIAQYNLGVMYYNGWDVEQDCTEALKYFKLAANREHAGALNYLGIMYYNGQGVRRDYTEALKYFELAASQKHAVALNYLGIMYGNGEGVKQNFDVANMFFHRAADLQRAADQGDAGVLNYLGIMYYNGHGVKQGYVEAFDCFKLSAYGCDSDAEFTLGHTYYIYQEIMDEEIQENYQDYAETFEERAQLAAYNYKIAADQGNDDAQYNMGYMYYFGQGVERDYTEAFKYYKLAAD